VQVGFESQKVGKQEKKISVKTLFFFMKFSINCAVLQRSCNVLNSSNHYLLILHLVEDFFCRKKDIHKLPVIFHFHTTCKDNFFQGLFGFLFPGWWVRFTILNCRKTEKKPEMA
jgi:hypothetical protein